MKNLTILGIESSCDETAVAVVRDGRQILSNVVASQVELHRKYGGVFPEMASRQHVKAITPVFQEALEKAEVTWGEIDAVAATYGPGLAGSLVVGLNFAKGLALASSVLVEDLLQRNLLVPYRGEIQQPGAGYTALCRPEQRQARKVEAFLSWLTQDHLTP